MDRHNFKSRQACGLKNDVMRSKAPTLPTYTRRTHHPIHLKCTRFYAHKHHPLTCPHFLMAHIHRTKATEKKEQGRKKRNAKKRTGIIKQMDHGIDTVDDNFLKKWRKTRPIQMRTKSIWFWI